MNRRFIGVLAFAVVISLIASLAVYRLVAARMAAAAAFPVSNAVVAIRDVPVGSLLKADDLELVTWKGDLPKQAITAVDKAESRGVMNAVHRGDLVMDNQLAPKGAGTGLAVKIPAGMRAVAVKVNEVVGLAGFVLPRMRVDVIACGTPPGNSRDVLGTQSRTVLQNIEVLSAGQDIQEESDGKPVTVQVVNLLVTPEQAEVMSLAGNETKVQLVLRNPTDTDIAKTQGTATADLFNGRPRPVAVRRTAPPALPAPPAPKPVVMEKVAVPVTIEVISGAKRQDMKVGETIIERPAEEKTK
jgi:pilus assembly protein CpaB